MDKSSRERIPLHGTRKLRAALILTGVVTGLITGASAQEPEPYRFYGGDVEGDGKTPEMEACEYEELVEKQRCNRALNKTRCIDAIREECREHAAATKAEEGVDVRERQR